LQRLGFNGRHAELPAVLSSRVAAYLPCRVQTLPP
jgi:hypothetical protein